MLDIMAKVKSSMVNVRLNEQTHEEFKTVCELRGVSMSGFLHQFIVKAIREEKDREPSAFITQAESVDEQTREEIMADYKLRTAEIIKLNKLDKAEKRKAG